MLVPVGLSVDQSNPRPPSVPSDDSSATRKKLPDFVPILIVGGGPVGIANAILLARYGLDSIILERHSSRLGQPKAHVMNPRTLEILRQNRIEMLPARQVGLSAEEAKAILFASSMTGVEYGCILHEENAEGVLTITPEPMFNAPQPFIEDLLLQHALETRKVTYLRMHEWRGCIEESDKTITSSVLLRGSNTMQTIRSRYLIGCDGTNAKSRDVLRIPFETLDNQQEVVLYHVSVHFSADLSHLKPGLLWFILNPTGMGVFIAYNRKNSWVFTISYNPDVTPKETFTSEYCKDSVLKVRLSLRWHIFLLNSSGSRDAS
jgi:2,4-dichlorophenol 6-monooxygenase